jgi:type II secretory pathway pseudopilin PulG
MKTKRGWLIAIALLGIFLINEYRLQSSQGEQITALRTEIAKLRQQQDRLAIQAARSPLVVRAPIAAPAGPPLTAPAEPPLTAPPALNDDTAGNPTSRTRRWEDEARANLASVENAFAAEPTNDAWAMPTRVALRDRMTALSQASSSSLRGIDCRSSICRIEVVHRDADASRQFTDKAFTDPDERAWNGPVILIPPRFDPDGSVAVVMYLGREGTPLLKPE